jgi:hypothetical protein
LFILISFVSSHFFFNSFRFFISLDFLCSFLLFFSCWFS